MLFHHQLDPNKSRSIALCLLVVGLLLSCCSAVSQRVFISAFHLSANQGDFVHGFCMGVGIALEIGAVAVLAILNRRRLRNQSHS